MRLTRARGTVTAIGLACAVSLAMSGTANAAVISDFEGDAVDSTTPTGWTVVNERIDLGVTQLGGCTSQDTSNYAHTHLRDWADYAQSKGNRDNGTNHPNLSINGSTWEWKFYQQGTYDLETSQATIAGQLVWELSFSDDSNPDGIYLGPASATSISQLTYWQNLSTTDQATFIAAVFGDPTVRRDNDLTTFGFGGASEVKVIDGSALEPGVVYDDNGDPIDIVYARDGKILQLLSDIRMNGLTMGDHGIDEVEGDVAHGPAVVSDEFNSGPGRALTLSYSVRATDDDYHVFGYLLNTSTCEQTEVLDSTGVAKGWDDVTVDVTTTGTYRFVFVSGVYDYDWGGNAAATLYLDNVVEGPSTLPSTGVNGSMALFSAILMAAGTLLLVGRRSPA